MNKVSILDCTLRDGGYINNWEFGNKKIKRIIDNLVDAKIDIIECGFIRNLEYKEDSTVFSSVKQISKFISSKKPGILYAAMVEQHNYNSALIAPKMDDSVDIIRLTFRKKEWTEAKNSAKELMKKGYKVCIQPVGTTSYDDESLIALIKDVNELNPFAFYLVDTLGVMYRHEMRKFFYLIDNNLARNINLGFHSHNNLQMSFANAQEMIWLNRRRNIIIDTSCYGMGRGVGNLATELLADYINNNIEHRYSLIPILNIIDKYLMSIFAEQKWGYDLPYFLSATVKCHPNYATYLLKKDTISVEKIEKILNLIPLNARSEYNPDLIEQLYFEFQKYDIDDGLAVDCLRNIVSSKNVLIIAPGANIIKQKKIIDQLIEREDPYVITVNFDTDLYKADAFFISNEKRFSEMKLDTPKAKKCITTSNLGNLLINHAIVFDYASLLGEGDASDNAGSMLIRILKRVGVSKIYLAGFDGFDVNSSVNYYDSNKNKAMDYSTTKKKNDDITKQLKIALCGIDYEVVTDSKYEI
ncbi:MAG: aldolase catalytic domain-containing protein [Phocaeicola vulgatus]|nr:aldolase catalytic domain-containing protein [Phocaeicola vulgatus]